MSCQVAIDDRELLTEQNGRSLRGHFVGAQESAQEIRKIHGKSMESCPCLETMGKSMGHVLNQVIAKLDMSGYQI